MSSPKLVRHTSLPGAVLLGLGAIVGTGAYVSIALATEMAGSWVLFAILIAALVAACNGLSSAQLAAVHPVSGGTYEYGYQFLTPWAGFIAGWLFVAAKSASAATAALAFGLYVLPALGLPLGLQIPLALLVLLALMILVNGGMRRSNTANLVIVCSSIGALLIFSLYAVLTADETQQANVLNYQVSIADSIGWREFLGSAALLFVAYTGYGRIATMGEEVANPRRTIPIAIAVTVVVTTLLYVLIGYALLHTSLYSAPQAVDDTQLALVALADANWLRVVVLVGAAIALLGVILNLILGVSRVILAMGRRNDLPAHLAHLNAARTSAPNSVYAATGVMAVLALLGDVQLAWSFSAFTVLAYYSITNLAALKVAPAQRFVPKWVSWLGLASCVGLTFFIDGAVFAAGCAFIAVGLAWHQLRSKRHQA
ncbi:APC family permease [Aliidiomarina maris]|uniref:Amino acid transporter n=1 Tax=Aliidiomarina maris TaxID=531312 RepID=A0A327WU98_9GAMM|nr:APC family permease [Aliidiomarina maris]RAJ96396.1 amino acid/polyamine/organocation transporter (APC superfamily) [Aliidiomarina maris]RUO22828.1 amino acid transporter [Aliidiomarina maris]